MNLNIHLVNPYATRNVFPLPEKLRPDEYGLVALGGHLTPGILREAYSKGIFPWSGEHPIPWFSPSPRAVLLPHEIKIRRSLRQTLRKGRLKVRFDTRFEAMMTLCATIPRKGEGGTWITPNMIRAWVELHHEGYAHSVEVYQDEELVGGLYGMAMGRAFFGESMCSSVPDASKVALVALCQHLDKRGFYFVDCQQDTGHLKSMGSRTWPRATYLSRLKEALEPPLLHRW